MSSSYWDFTVAKNLFWPWEDEENVLIGIGNQLKILCAANSLSDAYEEVIDKGNNGVGDDDDEKLSEYQFWVVMWKVLILTISLLKSQETMERVKKWRRSKDWGKQIWV
jgi:hypothetical protein